MEEEAVSFYELQRDCETVKVGFITNDEGTIGASPDRLVGEDGLLEIKVPKESTHVSYLLKKAVDQAYYPQVQGQLWVSGRKWVDILSYHPEMPPALIRVERDEEFIAFLQSAVVEFSSALEKQAVEAAARGWIPEREEGFGDLGVDEDDVRPQTATTLPPTQPRPAQAQETPIPATSLPLRTSEGQDAQLDPSSEHAEPFPAAEQGRAAASITMPLTGTVAGVPIAKGDSLVDDGKQFVGVLHDGKFIPIAGASIEPEWRVLSIKKLFCAEASRWKGMLGESTYYEALFKHGGGAYHANDLPGKTERKAVLDAWKVAMPKAPVTPNPTTFQEMQKKAESLPPLPAKGKPPADDGWGAWEMPTDAVSTPAPGRGAGGLVPIADVAKKIGAHITEKAMGDIRNPDAGSGALEYLEAALEQAPDEWTREMTKLLAVNPIAFYAKLAGPGWNFPGIEAIPELQRVRRLAAMKLHLGVK